LVPVLDQVVGVGPARRRRRRRNGRRRWRRMWRTRKKSHHGQ
jgi:hypothetical protein